MSALKFTQKMFNVVEYKESHQLLSWKRVSIRAVQTTRSGNSNEIKVPKVSTDKKSYRLKKIKAIKSMFPWMPQVDKEYFEAILPK